MVRIRGGWRVLRVDVIRRLAGRQSYQKLMSSNGKQSQRRNLHMDKPAPSASAQVHIFTKNPKAHILPSLQDQLAKKHHSFKLHNNPNQLSEIIASTQERTLVLIDSNREAHETDTVFPKYYKFPYSNHSLKLFTFPNKISGSGLPNLAAEKEVLAECARLFGSPAARIKLSSVHSIRGSKDGKFESGKSLSKATPNTVYEDLLFFRDSGNDYGSLYDTAQFVELTSCLQAEKYKPYQSEKDLQRKEPPKPNRKYLLVASNSEKSLALLQSLAKKKQNYDIVLMGNLEPTDYLLEDNVVLASQDPAEIINFLFQNGFESTALRELLLRCKAARNDGEGAGPQNGSEKGDATKIVIVPPFQSAGELGGFGRNSNNESTINAFATLEAAPSRIEEQKGEEKKKIRRIRSPAKGRAREEEKSEGVDNSINIVVSTHGDEPLKETEEHTFNKQGEKIPKQSSFKRQDSSSSTSRRNDMSFTTADNKPKPIPASAVSAGNVITGVSSIANPISGYDAKVPQVGETHFLKKSTALDSKYRNNPSTIIHEMSDEYRGSNKESIVNLQPEASYRINKNSTSYSQNQPYEEKVPKRIVNNSIQYANAPDSYYYSRTSENNMEEKPAGITYNQTSQRVINSNPSSSSISNHNIGSANNISSNSIRYATNNYQTSTNTYQSPTSTYQQAQTATNTYQPSSNTYQSINSYQSTSNTPTAITTLPASNYYNPPSGTIYTLGGQSKGVRTYGRVSETYNSPTKIIRKEQTSAPEEYRSESKGQIQNRITFGSNQLNIINGLNGSRTTTPATPAATTVTETVRTHSPSYTSYTATQASSPNYSSSYYNVQTLNYHKLNNQPYNNRIQISTGKTNEVATYAHQTTPTDPVPNIAPYNYMSPPKVEMKSTRTLVNNTGINLEEYERIERDGRVVYKKKIQVEVKPNVESSAYSNQPSSPTVRRYEVSPVRQTQIYDKRSSDYRNDNIFDTFGLRQKTEEADNGLGEMIESSHKKREEGRVSVGTRIYGGPRVEVERVERMEPRVQACSPNNRPALNESNMFFSRASELHSDGSILRRNNARFGIKRKEEKADVSLSLAGDSGLGSGLLRLNELNKKMALNRVMSGEEYLKEEAERYGHINTALSNFHFLVEDSLTYLSQTIQKHLASPYDSIDHFTGSHQLLEKIKTQEQCEVGFILARVDQMVGVNFSLLPENYYFVQLIEEDEQTLEISEQNHKIRLDSLNQLPLAQKIILDSKLDQYVIYRGSGEVEKLAEKFLNSEFILDKINTEFSCELLDSYYAPQPRLTRLYILCSEEELPALMAAVKEYEDSNPSFRRASCKLLCLLTNILKNDELILSQPQVTFISNPLQIETHRHLLAYAHHYDPRPNSTLPCHRLFYHRGHSGLPQLLHHHFPARFHLIPYSRVAEAQLKADRLSRTHPDHQNYLVLHESVNGQAIRSDLWSKVYMLGKAKVVQPRVMRVLDPQELVELLRK